MSSSIVVEIVVDEREVDLYAEITRINTAGIIPIRKCVLPLGDILFQQITPSPETTTPPLPVKPKKLTKKQQKELEQQQQQTQNNPNVFNENLSHKTTCGGFKDAVIMQDVVEVVVENEVIVDDETNETTIPAVIPPKTLMIFERKTLQDLLSSILDGRYKEQSFRLLSATETPPHNIVYLIEGLMSSIKDVVKKRRIYSALTSILYFKKMSVLRTWAVQETAELLLQMATKIHKELTEKTAGNSVCEMERQYSSVVVGSQIKRENITTANIGEIILSQIPGISLLAANSIMQRFGNSFAELMQVLLNDPYTTRFDDIMYEVSAGKMRRISKTCVESLRLFLIPNAPAPPPPPVKQPKEKKEKVVKEKVVKPPKEVKPKKEKTTKPTKEPKTIETQQPAV